MLLSLPRVAPVRIRRQARNSVLENGHHEPSFGISVLAVLEHGVELGRQDRVRFEEFPRIVDRK